VTIVILSDVTNSLKRSPEYSHGKATVTKTLNRALREQIPSVGLLDMKTKKEI